VKALLHFAQRWAGDASSMIGQSGHITAWNGFSTSLLMPAQVFAPIENLGTLVASE